MHRLSLPKHPTTLVLMLVCLITAISGCGSRQAAGKPTTRYATGGTFTMAIRVDVGAFDPYRNPQIKSYYKLAYDSLVNEQRDGTYASGLAAKWTVDARSATFVLRPGITCSDGTPLTASQVAADLNYAGDLDNHSSLYGSQVPAVPFTTTADDTTRTVRVQMKKPFGFLLNTIGVTPIICAKGLRNPKLVASASDGTGPFVLTKVVPGQSYTFTVRKGYNWGPNGAGTDAPGTPGTVVLRVIANQTTATNLLLAGELNFTVVASEDRQRLAGRGFGSVSLPSAGAWLWFNQIGDRVTRDKRIRQALVHGLDLQEVTKVNTGGTGKPATGLAPGQPNPCPETGSVADQLPAHDVAAAERLLDGAGWAKGSNGIRAKNGRPLRINLHYLASLSPFEKATAELIAQRWRGIGVDARTSTDTDAGFAQTFYQTSSFDVYMIGLGTNLPSSAVKYLSGPTPPQGSNTSGIKNAGYEGLVAKAGTMTPPASCTYWQQAERALFRDVEIAPISIRYTRYFMYKADAQVVTFSVPIPTSIKLHE